MKREDIDHTPEVKKWLAELDAAEKRDRDWKKKGREIVEIYEAGKRSDNPFNILFSNTETLLPALFNNTPRPEVKRRFNDADPIGKLASNVLKRSLEFLMDSNDEDYATFDDLMASAVLESLLPGRGITRFKYEAKIKGEGENAMVEAETVVGEEVPWDRVRTGYGKKWKQVPWLAFEHFMNKEEAKKHFPDHGDKIAFDITPGTEDKKGDDGEAKTSSDDSSHMLAQIFEIWDKTSRQVIFVSVCCGEILKSTEAPLKLSGFFPCPRPLQLIQKISSIVPTPLYSYYESQAEELNVCTRRIDKITRAMKIRGFYDGTLQGMQDLMKAEDNTLLPAENVAGMLQGQTLDRAIWFFPIEKLVGVLQQLYSQREQIKGVIYEITGVSDILRGASRASETATAQNIKNQWGTLRLKRSQKEVMRYVRDCLRLMAEIAGEHLGVETLSAMTGLQYPTAQQKEQAQGMMQQLQSMQPPAQPGQPPAPPPPEMEKLQKILSLPSWEDIQAVLKGDVQRQYKIDIETNSTVDAEATEDKADVAEFLNSLSQFLNGVAPMIEQGYMSFDVAKTMLMSIVRRFRFGVEVEDQIAEMQAPPPKEEGDDPKVKAEQAKMQMEQQRNEAEMAHKQQLFQLEQQQAQERMALEREQMDLEREKMNFERERLAAEHADALQAIQQKGIIREEDRIFKQQQQVAQAEEKAVAATQSQGE